MHKEGRYGGTEIWLKENGKRKEEEHGCTSTKGTSQVLATFSCFGSWDVKTKDFVDEMIE